MKRSLTLHLLQAGCRPKSSLLPQKTGAYIARTPVYMEGRIELLQYLRQQSICHNDHCYGNLGDRSLD
ncbi:hypothetical protein [uncultured Desulfobulbus sp.]|uniref:hypothetical protein n=1 Tax=uncultured Desulfobulbus sp. TaxID=239745 RepID=UPI0029C7BB33|nr:hypothetical protein [uncultured Desulfobulbus sp.]